MCERDTTIGFEEHHTSHVESSSYRQLHESFAFTLKITKNTFSSFLKTSISHKANIKFREHF